MLSFQSYKRLTKIILWSETIENIADHTLLVLEWNLIARADNSVGAKVEHISFRPNTLLFNFVNTKTAQEGIKHFDQPWHEYANPLEPVGCPLLALARYIITHPSIFTGQMNLFELHYQYECFNRIFNKVVQNHQSEFEYLGISVEDFWQHSIRKGV